MSDFERRFVQLLSKLDEAVDQQKSLHEEEDDTDRVDRRIAWRKSMTPEQLCGQVCKKVLDGTLNATMASSGMSGHLRFAKRPIREMQLVNNKKDLARTGSGRVVLSSLFFAHDWDGTYLDHVTSIVHVWYAYRTLMTYWRATHEEPTILPLQYLKFSDPDMQQLSRMTNICSAVDQRSLLYRLPEVRSHDVFKLGPRAWSKGSSVTPVKDAVSSGDSDVASKLLGLRSELHFDAFMNKLFLDRFNVSAQSVRSQH